MFLPSKIRNCKKCVRSSNFQNKTKSDQFLSKSILAPFDQKTDFPHRTTRNQSNNNSLETPNRNAQKTCYDFK